jgi:hypothetical protein
LSGVRNKLRELGIFCDWYLCDIFSKLRCV